MRSRRLGRTVLAAALGLAPLIAAGGGAGVEEIEYYHRVSDRVAFGGQPTPSQVMALAQAGLRSIINLREEPEIDARPEIEAAKDASLVYIALPVPKAQPTDEQVKKFLQVTDDAGIYPVFIHCATANRAAALWMVRRAIADGWSMEAAEKEAVQNGLTSEGLLQFAREYIASHGSRQGP